jgi:hypothetical protein
MLHEMPLQFLYNMLVVSSAWEGIAVSKVVLLIIADICGRPEPDEIWNIEAPMLFITGIEAKLWGAIVVELALRAALAMNRLSVSRVFAIIIAMLIPKIRGIPMIVAETIVKSATVGFDEEATRWILSALNWTISRHIEESTELGVAVLQFVGTLRQYLEANPDAAECAQIVDWADRQREKLGEGTKEKWNEALKNSDNRVAAVPVPETPPQIEFNFRDHVKELFMIPTCDYFSHQKGVCFACPFLN